MAKYTVKSGESWASIAGKVYGGDQRYFNVLMSANSGVGMLHPGMVIEVPDISKYQKGLKESGQLHYVGPDDVAQANLYNVASGFQKPGIEFQPGTAPSSYYQTLLSRVGQPTAGTNVTTSLGPASIPTPGSAQPPGTVPASPTQTFLYVPGAPSPTSGFTVSPWGTGYTGKPAPVPPPRSMVGYGLDARTRRLLSDLEIGQRSGWTKPILAGRNPFYSPDSTPYGNYEVVRSQTGAPFWIERSAQNALARAQNPPAQQTGTTVISPPYENTLSYQIQQDLLENRQEALTGYAPYTAPSTNTFFTAGGDRRSSRPQVSRFFRKPPSVVTGWTPSGYNPNRPVTPAYNIDRPLPSGLTRQEQARLLEQGIMRVKPDGTYTQVRIIGYEREPDGTIKRDPLGNYFPIYGPVINVPVRGFKQPETLVRFRDRTRLVYGGPEYPDMDVEPSRPNVRGSSYGTTGAGTVGTAGAPYGVGNFSPFQWRPTPTGGGGGGGGGNKPSYSSQPMVRMPNGQLVRPATSYPRGFQGGGGYLSQPRNANFRETSPLFRAFIGAVNWRLF